MGRHSRKGRAKAGDTSEPAVRRGDAPPSYGMAQADTATRPAYPSDPRGPSAPPNSGYGPRDPAPNGARQWQRNGPGPSVRGGHPEQREPGGGWGADAAERGPGRPAGRVLQGAAGAPGRTGPRQEYVDAFEDDIFGGAAALIPSTPQAPARPAPYPTGLGSDTRRPGTPGPWNDYGRRPGAADTGQFESVRPQLGQGVADRAVREEPSSAPPRHPGQPGMPQTKKGGKGRAATGVLAAAVTTVLAVIIAGQVTGGGPGDDGAAGTADTSRGQSDEGAASRSDDGRGAPGGEPQAAPLSYAEKMDKTFPLDAGFEGKGTFSAVKGGEDGSKGGEVLRYRVDVEKGLPLESDLFAKAVHKTLNDKRSWAHEGERSFKRVDGRDADFVITLASSPTTDVWCAKSGLDTSEERVSCDSASTERVMINAYRWAQGAKTFGDDRMLAYRQMLINHEVGHRIGFDHVGCPKDGALAPVMMQQTKTVKTGGAKCRPNAWAHPRG